MAAAHVNIAFVEDRIFSATQQLLFKLAICTEADLTLNLERLKVGAEPDEQVAYQLWKLLQIGTPVRRLVDVLRLIQDLEWTTLAAEQQHASAANLSRFHPEYGLMTLTARALVCSANRLMPSTSEAEKQIDKYRSVFAKAEKQNPCKVRAQHLFFRDLLGAAKRKYGAEHVAGQSNVKKKVFKQAPALFEAQSSRV